MWELHDANVVQSVVRFVLIDSSTNKVPGKLLTEIFSYINLVQVHLETIGKFSKPELQGITPPNSGLAYMDLIISIAFQRLNYHSLHLDFV